MNISPTIDFHRLDIDGDVAHLFYHRLGYHGFREPRVHVGRFAVSGDDITITGPDVPTDPIDAYRAAFKAVTSGGQNPNTVTHTWRALWPQRRVLA